MFGGWPICLIKILMTCVWGCQRVYADIQDELLSQDLENLIRHSLSQRVPDYECGFPWTNAGKKHIVTIMDPEDWTQSVRKKKSQLYISRLEFEIYAFLQPPLST